MADEVKRPKPKTITEAIGVDRVDAMMAGYAKWASRLEVGDRRQIMLFDKAVKEESGKFVIEPTYVYNESLFAQEMKLLWLWDGAEWIRNGPPPWHHIPCEVCGTVLHVTCETYKHDLHKTRLGNKLFITCVGEKCTLVLQTILDLIGKLKVKDFA